MSRCEGVFLMWQDIETKKRDSSILNGHECSSIWRMSGICQDAEAIIIRLREKEADAR
jgi:hypothetical protein